MMLSVLIQNILGKVKNKASIILSVLILLSVLGLYMYINSLKDNINKLIIEKQKCELKYNNERVQSNLYKQELDRQTLQIQNLEIRNKDIMDKYHKWKKLPPKIKYKTIVKIRKVKSNDCKDIKNTINDVRAIDYNKL